ncbi:hypothetical protein [Priestia filamentosa]|uniref:hypothetical protein n=1 Tax=Priestia filamentosa TaxID=1402861 RepID=UPI000A08A067|nr:hypothetical protein [Priestia filamentosa]MDT3765813.1 hypothetical protein [Priestia filamentosa]OXS65259.1 hypothetical protein B1B01_23255 [Priestia filamentosa]SMF69855.1 hypothetical protein SAMN06296056_11147 [Priestia filamentosa]
MAHKISVTGRPTSSIQDYGKYLAFDMEEKGSPNAPKGIPFKSNAITYTIVLSQKQFNKLNITQEEFSQRRFLVQGEPCLDIPFEQCTGEIGVICMQIQEIEDKGKEKKQPKQTPKKGSRANNQEESKPQEESKQEQEKKPEPKPLLVPKGTREWMSLDDIKVPESFLQFTPGIAKQKAVEESIEKNGTVDKPIIINPETYELLDSYSRYYVAKKKKLDCVPVHY